MAQVERRYIVLKLVNCELDSKNDHIFTTEMFEIHVILLENCKVIIVPCVLC